MTRLSRNLFERQYDLPTASHFPFQKVSIEVLESIISLLQSQRFFRSSAEAVARITLLPSTKI